MNGFIGASSEPLRPVVETHDRLQPVAAVPAFEFDVIPTAESFICSGRRLSTLLRASLAQWPRS